MSIIGIVVALVIVGFFLWLAMQIPMPPVWKNVVMGVVIFLFVLWIFQTLGFIGALPILKIK